MSGAGQSERPGTGAAQAAPATGAGVWFVIPAYNEETRIREVAASAARVASVVVVDDGSRDETAAAAAAAGAHVVRMPINRGQGAALQTGMTYALRQGADYIVTFDADGQHRLEDALRMVERLRRDGLDVVLGSRFLGSTENMSAARGMLLKAATAFTNLTTGLALTDTHNGLRALTREAALKVELTQDRMAHASEFLEIIRRTRMRVAEEPVKITYTAYSMAKGQRLGDALRILEDLFWGWLAK